MPPERNPKTDVTPTDKDQLKVSLMIHVLGHDSALQGYIGLGTSWANEMNFVMNHAAGA